MKKLIILLLITGLCGCASSIVTGEYIKTGSLKSSKTVVNEEEIGIYFANQNVNRKYREVGRVLSRSYVLEKRLKELKKQAVKLGANAIISVKYERKFSVDYLQDLYFLEGIAIVWK